MQARREIVAGPNGAHRVSAKVIVWCTLVGVSAGYVDFLGVVV